MCDWQEEGIDSKIKCRIILQQERKDNKNEKNIRIRNAGY